MPIIKFNNHKEIEVWNNMKKQLEKHNSRDVKDSYFKRRMMDDWEKEKCRIESEARLKIINMQKLDKEKQEKKKKQKNESELENVLLAAEALIMMKQSIPRPEGRISKRPKNTSTEPLRRSQRIIEKEIDEISRNCPGCKDKQPNQLAHMGPNGCLGDDSNL